MITYVESNFVLELAFRQEGHLGCESLLQLAESGAVRLVLPAFCVGEPYERLVRRNRQRRDVHRKLTDEGNLQAVFEIGSRDAIEAICFSTYTHSFDLGQNIGIAVPSIIAHPQLNCRNSRCAAFHWHEYPSVRYVASAAT